MKFKIPTLSLSICAALLTTACGGSSSSSDDTSPPVVVTPPPAGGEAVAATEGDASKDPNAAPSPAPVTVDPVKETPTVPVATAELQEVIKLNSNFLEYPRLQYDCGDIKVPVSDAAVVASLKGAKSFETLAATLPAKDQAMVKISTTENGVSCDYRAIFSVNKAFTEVTYVSSQSLNGDSFTACGQSKAAIDTGFGLSPIAFEYDKKFISWVALHIPLEMQATPVCPAGKLRAVFAG